MNRPRPEVAEVIREAAGEYQERYGLSGEQGRVLRDLAQCRTAALGGHTWVCNRCGHERIAYNSCRNRHCPKCQAMARAAWLADRAGELLPVPYFHVVFTVPEEIGPVALHNRRRVYGLLFRAVAQTLLTIGRDPQHLGAELGFLAVLHTWGQTLQHHPHIHCVVPAGGLAPDQNRWIPGPSPRFFLPVRVLSRLFRGKVLAALDRAHAKGQLSLPGRCSPLRDPAAWAHWLAGLRSQEWVVYAKPPFGGAEQVLKYLARYTHRVAIANRRLVALENGQVTFRYKDYAQGQRQKKMTLDAVEFLRRFLLHLLPAGFMRIRSYGFLANRARRKKLAHIRGLLRDGEMQALPDQPPPRESPANAPWRCPQCQVGSLVRVGSVPVGAAVERAPPPLAA